MSDLISRQAAIDALKGCYCGGEDSCGEPWIYESHAIKAIKQLPPIQSEIIRCKDCKHWMPHSQLGYDEDNETYHDYCEKLIPEDEYYAFYRDADDFCSRAERKE